MAGFMQAVAQRCSGPRMATLVTMGSPHQGVSATPGCGWVRPGPWELLLHTAAACCCCRLGKYCRHRLAKGGGCTQEMPIERTSKSMRSQKGRQLMEGYFPPFDSLSIAGISSHMSIKPMESCCGLPACFLAILRVLLSCHSMISTAQHPRIAGTWGGRAAHRHCWLTPVFAHGYLVVVSMIRGFADLLVDALIFADSLSFIRYADVSVHPVRNPPPTCKHCPFVATLPPLTRRHPHPGKPLFPATISQCSISLTGTQAPAPQPKASSTGVLISTGSRAASSPLSTTR